MILPKNYGVLDVETTIFEGGHPFAERNKLCILGLRIDGQNHTFTIEYGSEPYAEKLGAIQKLLDSLDLLVGFNFKFDLNWIRRYGLRVDHCRVFDLQLVEFILGGQRPPFPSLNDCLAKRGLGQKLDIVKTEYWDRGIDTTEIPRDVLIPYSEEDLVLEDNLFKAMLSEIPKDLEALITLSNQDLLVLHEMEFNGIKINWEKLGARAEATRLELQELAITLADYIPEQYRSWFNIDSGDHLSALLYGGCITRKVGTEYQHTYKTGPRAGQTETRYRWEIRTDSFPQLVTPPKGSELKKEGFFSTDEETLRSLKRPKKLIHLLLKHAELSKLLSTYLDGLVKIREKYDWSDEMLHGTFNQCRTITGRLSSEKPNLQNQPPEVGEFIETRYD